MQVVKTFGLVICYLVITFILSSCTLNDDSKILRLAHNQGTDHAIHISLKNFADLVKQSEEEVSVQIYPNGQLGQERDVIEMVKAGVLDFAKVSASSLEAFDSNYKIFSLPYVFQSREHYFNVMDNSQAVKEIFENSKNKGFISLGWYDAGQRSIYLKRDGGITSPKDLQGLKIRVQESPTSMSMIKAMGGSPTPMTFGEVYTSLQQNIIDGAENNESALTINNHGEVARSYVYTEHQYSPDIIIVSPKRWEKLTTKQQDLIISSIKQSSEEHKEEWNKMISNSVEEAEKMGVDFYKIDTSEFIKSVSSLHEEFIFESNQNKIYFDDFQSYLK